MGMYKVGDRVKVTKLLGMDSFENIRVGDVHTVTMIKSDRGAVGIRIGSNNEYPLIHDQIEKVEESEQVYKIGDTIKVAKLITANDHSWLKIGETHTVLETRYDGAVYIKLPKDSAYPMLQQQIEKVEEEVKVREFEVGDKVKVLVENSCGSGAEKGKVYTVKELDGKSLQLKEITHQGAWVPSHHVELVTNQTSFTFPEMAQKLIDGDFEEGAEVTAKDRDGDIKTYYVGKNQYGYGLADSEGWFLEDTSTNPSSLNGRWEIVLPKEEPIKEMSIEEVQKELGYKIKITE